MKPVNLLPSDVAVARSSSGTSMGMIGGAVAGVVAIAVVAGYFAMARVDSLKSETAAATTRATASTDEAAAVTAEVQSLGQPVADSDKQIAQGAEKVLVSAYTERHDFVLLAKELRAIMENTGGWYTKVEASSAGGDNGGISIEAVMPSKERMATFNERVNATKTMTDAVTVSVESTVLRDIETGRPGVYYSFTVSAKMVDTVAPYATFNGGVDAPANQDGLTVADAGGSGEVSLSLDPKPAAAPAAPVKPPKPKNPFDFAATVAGGGS